MNRFIKWTEREYGFEQRITATILAGVLFVILVPYFIYWTAMEIGGWLSLYPHRIGLFNLIVGGIIPFVGLVFALWSIVVLLSSILIHYLKQVKERELEERFGDAYVRYKSEPPFLFPRLRRGNQTEASSS